MLLVTRRHLSLHNPMQRGQTGRHVRSNLVGCASSRLFDVAQLWHRQLLSPESACVCLSFLEYAVYLQRSREPSACKPLKHGLVARLVAVLMIEACPCSCGRNDSCFRTCRLRLSLSKALHTLRKNGARIASSLSAHTSNGAPSSHQVTARSSMSLLIAEPSEL
jgi:hypothetical protein